MSDQSPLHKSVTRILLGVVLLSSVAALVLTSNSGSLPDSMGGQTVARIGSKNITAQEFQNIYARRIAQSGLSDSDARLMGVPSMVLQKEIERQTLLQASEKLGIRIDNTYVATQLKKQLEQIKLSGTPQEKLQIILQQQQITEKELVNLLRGDFAINVLASTASTGDLKVPDELLKSAYQYEKEKRSADIIAITPQVLKDAKPLSQKDIDAYYKENGEKYRTVETRDVTILTLPKTLFGKEVNISDAQAEAFYKDHADQFMSPERVRLEQVIVDSKEAADKIVVKKPTSLESLKEDQFLKSDWYGKNTLPTEFSEALYPTQPTGIVGPIKTDLGWHVVNVTEYQKAQPLSFAEAKSTIIRQLKDDQLDKQMNDFTSELDSAISEEASLNEIAKKYDLKPVTVEGIQVKDKLANVKLSDASKQRVTEAAFTLQDDEISPLLDTTDGDYLLVQVTKIDSAHIPSLKEIEATVKADAAQAHESKQLLNKAEELVGLFDPKKPEAFIKAVQANKLPVKATAALTKADMAEDYDANLAELVFTLGPKNTLSYTQDKGKISLVRLKTIKASNDLPDPKTSEALYDKVKNDMVQELQQQFMAAWQKELKVSVNMQLMQTLFGPQAPEQQ